jgi:hypothetical protein
MSEIKAPIPFNPDDNPLGISYPSFYDLQDHAESNLLKKGIARYLIPRNYEKSIRRHQALGSPIVRKVVMGTIGRITTSGQGGNYRLDSRRSPIEASANFAFRGSVFNEAVHTIGALPSSFLVAEKIIEGKGATISAISVAGIGLNLALVALQRYNRARMIQNVDTELSSGHVFREGYENYLGIDGRAVDNYIINSFRENWEQKQASIDVSEQ